MPYKNRGTQLAAQQKHYQDNYERYRLARQRSRKRIKDWLNEQKSKPCNRCGQNYPPVVMDFHHRDPQTKLFEVAAAISRYSRQRMIDEIAKCDLLCANCHRLEEAGL